MTKVTITLRPHVAERLRKMCHAKGITASDLIDRWVFEHDDLGNAIPPPKSNVDKSQDLVDPLGIGKLFK